MITEPGNGALDDPSAAIAAQRPAILSQVLGPTVGAVRRDHFDAQFCEGLIKGVAIITLVSDEAFWLKVSLDEAQGLLDHRGLTDAGCIQRESQGNSLCINHKLHLGSFTFARQTNRGSSALGRGKSGIHKALFQVDSTLFDRLTDNGSKDTPERIGLTPRLQIVVHVLLGGKFRRFSLDSVCSRPKSCARADVSSLALERNRTLKDLSQLGSTCAGSVSLSKAKRSGSTPQFVAARGELCSATATIRYLGTSQSPKVAFERMSSSTVRLGSRFAGKDLEKYDLTRRSRNSSQFFAYFGTRLEHISLTDEYVGD